MIVFDKLLEIGVKCPRGNALMCTKDDAHSYRLWCACCGMTPSDGAYTSMLGALTSWLVLTGGPIPWSIEPPTHDAPRLTSDCGKTYFLAPHQRTPEIIRPWLEEEI